MHLVPRSRSWDPKPKKSEKLGLPIDKRSRGTLKKREQLEGGLPQGRKGTWEEHGLPAKRKLLEQETSILPSRPYLLNGRCHGESRCRWFGLSKSSLDIVTSAARPPCGLFGELLLALPFGSG